MKTKTKTLALLPIICIILLSSCSKPSLQNGDQEALFKSPHFVDSYINPIIMLNHIVEHKDGEVINNYQQGSTTNYSTIAIVVRHTPLEGDENGDSVFTREQADQIINKSIIEKTYKSSDNMILDTPYDPLKNRIYDSLCKAHNDLKYNRTYYYHMPVMYKYAILDIISDTDYDTAHPKGSKLNDVFLIKFESVKEYLEANNRKSKGYVSPFTMPLSQYNTQKRSLIGSSKVLIPNKAPAHTSTHCFTITYTDEAGKVLTTTTAPITIKGVN